MRSIAVLSVLAFAALPIPAFAQTPSPIAALPIPLPPGAAVQMELDSRDQDLLGMVKSLLTGAATPAGSATAKSSADANPFLSLLSDGQLTALLKDIHHLHVLSFKPADAAASPTAPPADLLAFYETPFEAEGGHRILYLNGPQKVVMVGFDQPRGFAAAVQSSGSVFVVRADGYPNMTVLGSLLRMFGGMVPGLPTTAPTLAASSPPTAHHAPHIVPKAHPKARRR